MKMKSILNIITRKEHVLCETDIKRQSVRATDVCPDRWYHGTDGRYVRCYSERVSRTPHCQ